MQVKKSGYPLGRGEEEMMLDIVEVISKHVDLELNGNSFFGICPACHEIVWVHPETQQAFCEGLHGKTRNLYQYAAHIGDN